MDWKRHGNWEAMTEREAYRIFPKDKEGKTRVLWVKRVFIRLRRQLKDGSYAELFFKHYLHQRNRYWRDSRHEKGSCPKKHVQTELARLLFDGNREQALNMMLQAEAIL